MPPKKTTAKKSAPQKPAPKRSAPKKPSPKAPPAARRLAALLASLDAPSDEQAWADQFVDALRQRVLQVSSAEECVVFCLGVGLFQRDFENGGLAQAFINYGWDSDIAHWCVKGFRAFHKPEAAALMKRAITIAKRDADTLGRIAGQKSKAGIDAYVEYRKRGTFGDIERQLHEHTIGPAELMTFVKRRRRHFSALCNGT